MLSRWDCAEDCLEAPGHAGEPRALWSQQRTGQGQPVCPSHHAHTAACAWQSSIPRAPSGHLCIQLGLSPRAPWRRQRLHLLIRKGLSSAASTLRPMGTQHSTASSITQSWLLVPAPREGTSSFCLVAQRTALKNKHAPPPHCSSWILPSYVVTKALPNPAAWLP